MPTILNGHNYDDSTPILIIYSFEYFIEETLL